jgi:hypothetical protein
MVEVLNRVEPRFGSPVIAYAWYRSTPLPGFDGQTAAASHPAAGQGTSTS